MTLNAINSKNIAKQFWIISNVILVCSVIACSLIKTFADPDLWGHLRFGLDTLANRGVVRIDPYSYLTAGQPWINHEWLSEVFFAIAWNLDGVTGLILLKVLIGFVVFGLLYRHLRSLEVKPIRSAILLILELPLLIYALGVIRPQMFTVLFFTLTLIIIYQAEKGSYRGLWLLPLIFALWVNFHGGFFAGLGILGLWGLVHLITVKISWKEVIVPVALSFIATIINPYGISLLQFLLQTATVPRPEILEWVPLKLVSTFGFYFLPTLLVSVLGLIFTHRPRRLSLMVVFGTMCLMPFVAERHVPLFALSAVILAGEHIDSVWSGLMPSKSRTFHVPIWASILPFAGAVAMFISMIPKLTTIKILEDAYPYPQKAVYILKQSGVSGNLITGFNWGEYIIWYLGPQVKVSMDGRRETVYSFDTYRENANFILGQYDWDRLLAEHPTDMALIYKGSAADNLMRSYLNWSLVYEDSVSALFAKNNSTNKEKILNAVNQYSVIEIAPVFP